MVSLQQETAMAKAIDIDALTDAIVDIGFACTQCGQCCTAEDETPHTAVLFPDEVRQLMGSDRDWTDVARPMPFGFEASTETFEWALQVDDCGDCRFHDDELGCTVYADRPLICQAYPFDVVFDSAEDTTPQEYLRTSACQGVGRSIDRDTARELAATIKERAIREREEALAVREQYTADVQHDADSPVVYDSEGAKHVDGSRYE